MNTLARPSSTSSPLHSSDQQHSNTHTRINMEKDEFKQQLAAFLFFPVFQIWLHRWKTTQIINSPAMLIYLLYFFTKMCYFYMVAPKRSIMNIKSWFIYLTFVTHVNVLYEYGGSKEEFNEHLQETPLWSHHIFIVHFHM